MNPRTNYEMTQTDLDEILDACKSTPCMMIGNSVGNTPQENANDAWARLGEKMGFDSMTVQPSSKGTKFFTAVPNETENQKESRLEYEAEEKRLANIARLTSEITERQTELEALENESG